MNINIFLDKLVESIGGSFFKWSTWASFPFLKVLILIFLVFYIFYSFLVLKQVTIMNEFLETKLSPGTKILATTLLLYSVIVFAVVLIL